MGWWGTEILISKAAKISNRKTRDFTQITWENTGDFLRILIHECTEHADNMCIYLRLFKQGAAPVRYTDIAWTGGAM